MKREEEKVIEAAIEWNCGWFYEWNSKNCKPLIPSEIRNLHHAVERYVANRENKVKEEYEK